MINLPQDRIAGYLFTRWAPETHCWWLVRDVYRSALGVDLPEYAEYSTALDHAREFKRNVVSGEWLELDEPENLCVVAMGRKTINHVGVWLAEHGKVLHLPEGRGGQCEDLVAIRAVNPITRFFRYAPANHQRS